MTVTVEATCFTPAQIPPEGLPEIVVAGRSNVGKSSLINALLGKKLAHVGGTPGKTRSINFYLVDGGDEHPSFRLVDLPGYGYAARSKTEKRDWLEWFVQQGKNLLVVFTKADKLPRGQWRGKVQQYVREGLYSVDVPIVTSAEKRAGLDELRSFIEKFLTAD